MPTDEAALVLILADDDVDTIISKVKTAGTRDVQLLIPEGVTTLHTPETCKRLHSAAQRAQISLLAISSDEQTLAAFRQNQIETIGVKEGYHIVMPDTPPPAPDPSRSPYVTNRLEDADTAPTRPSQIGDEDEEFLRSLASIDHSAPATPGEPAMAEMSQDDFDFMSDLDSLSDMMNADDSGRGATDDRHDAFAADLDDLSAAFAAEETQARATPEEATARSVPAEPPRRRIRPEDIELTAEEKERASRKPAASTTHARSGKADKKPTGSYSIRDRLNEGQEPVQKQRGGLFSLRSVLMLILLLVLLYFLYSFVGGMFAGNGASTPAVPAPIAAGQTALDQTLGWLWGAQSVTVVVNSPPAPTESQEILDLPIARTRIGAENTPAAVQSQEIRATVTFTETGEVTSETMAPAGSARGIITLYNQSTQQIVLPEGTEFIATNPDGAEVYFTSDEAAVLNGSVTSRQGAQIITTLGQANITITARTPGSGGNVSGNSISQIVVPGQGAIFANSGSILLEHGPITGGTEEPIRIVKDVDVQEALGPALEGLNNRVYQVLGAQVPPDQVLEIRTITPNADDFNQGRGYQQAIIPPIGQPVDPADPFFSLVVSGDFSALATPQGERLESQLQRAFPNQLAVEGRLPRGMAAGVEDWEWDGSMLTVDGFLEPTGEPLSLDDRVKQEIHAALAGKPRAEAQTILDSLVERGVISGYTLPQEIDVLPEQLNLVDMPAEQQPQ